MLYFSLFSGEIYDSPTILSDTFQIPLKTRPSSNCKKCHGRMYIHYNLTQKQYIMCSKCLKKHIDLTRLILPSKK
jgi:formylmethanofuran dehydrogenase subunit E